jgi:hypothetical protein
MFRALQNLLGGPAWRSNLEIWGEPLSYMPETGQITFLFSTTASVARDPQFLSRWSWQIRALNDDLYPPRTYTDQTLRNWVKTPTQMNRVTQLLRDTDLGFDLFATTVFAPPEALGRNYAALDHDASVLRVNCSGELPVVLGPVGANAVAEERLASLYRAGAKPLVGARVQANFDLYQAGSDSAPAMAVFSFDPVVSPLKLEELAIMLHELKSSATQNPVLQAAAAGPRASDQFWFYHRRFRVPLEITEGRAVYCGDVWVHRPYLPDGYFSDRTPRLIPILAQAGDTGGVELIPHDRVAHVFPATQASLFRLKA